MLTKYRLMLIALLLLIAFGGFVGFQRFGGEAHAELTGWPAFTMVYREESQSLSPDDQPGIQTIELVYEDYLHWKVTTLYNRAHPDIEGSYDVYDGKTIFHSDTRAGVTSSNDVSNDPGFYVPDRWLVPSYVPSLLETPNAQVQPGELPGTETVILTEEVPCYPPSEETEDPDACTQTLIEEVTYTSEHLIPVKMVIKRDGAVVSTITVEEVVFD